MTRLYLPYLRKVEIDEFDLFIFDVIKRVDQQINSRSVLFLHSFVQGLQKYVNIEIFAGNDLMHDVKCVLIVLFLEVTRYSIIVLLNHCLR